MQNGLPGLSASHLPTPPSPEFVEAEGSTGGKCGVQRKESPLLAVAGIILHRLSSA